MNLLKEVDFTKNAENEILLTRQNTLRLLVGVLGIVLPILLYVFLWVDTNYTTPLESISHYYFTRVSGIFTITISLLAMFLIIYKGKELVDFILSTVAGVFALLVVLFPTSNIDRMSPDFACSVTTLNTNEFRTTQHYISAAIFLLSLAAMALFVFTRSDKTKSMTPQKKIRNFCFRLCGSLMVAALVTALLGNYNVIHLPVFGDSLTFWMETIAVESFGFAWLIKAEVFFKDKHGSNLSAEERRVRNIATTI